MEKVIFNKGQGLGIISAEKLNFIDKVSVQFEFGTFIPGQKTDLQGMYEEPLEYLGLLKNETQKVMVFYIGEVQRKYYYSCWYYINEKRIANKYKEGTARDYNWINGKWK